MFQKKVILMEQGRFARYLFLVVLVVAVVGLLDSGFLEVTGFAPKKAPKAPSPAVKTCVDSDGGVIRDVKGTVSGEYVNGQAYSFTDRCQGANQVEYNCKSPSAMGVLNSQCPRGSACTDGACVSLCGNGRVDPTENCGTCPADASCGAGQECSNNACVALCGNSRVDEGETCSSCAGDVRCAADRQCQNGQCVVQPFCRDPGYVRDVRQNLSTHEGNYTVYTCQDDMTSAQRGCQGAAVVEVHSTPCQGGCNQTGGTCCFGRPLRTECSSSESGINVSFSTCLNREVQFPFTCGIISDGLERKRFYTACSADVGGCIPCGLRTCVHQGDWGPTTYLVNHTAGQDCRAGDSGFDAAC